MTGAQTQLIFDGGSMVLHANGEIADELNHFVEDGGIYMLNKSKEVKVLKKHLQKENNHELENIRQALVLGIREYFLKQGFSKAILGLSGGIDSALVLALAAEALGKDNVKAVLLPSRFSSEGSVTDAVEMAQKLGVPYEIISIEDTYAALEKTLAPAFKETAFGITEENMQSRSRGVILMALSNKFGYILLNTSNKSELAVGYGTLYGDMCGGLSVIGDLYKTEVYALADYLNKDGMVIPHSIISKAPSAELRPDQKDSDTLPPYELLDNILHLYIEERKGPDEIIQFGYDEGTVRRILKMVNTNEWKRLQAPPVLRVSAKAFGPGRRMPIVAKYLS
jgi:NAD+ synthase (glutamine-hydrolysing)